MAGPSQKLGGVRAGQWSFLLAESPWRIVTMRPLVCVVQYWF